MEKLVQFSVDDELYNKFVVALLLQNESERYALNNAIIRYIKESFKSLDNLKPNIRKPSDYCGDIEQMKRIRAETHQSWVNLRKAIYKRKHIPYSFGTANVEASSDSLLKRIERETNLTVDSILEYLDNNRLG